MKRLSNIILIAFQIRGFLMEDSDKRKYKRSSCSIDTNFDFYIGVPGEVDINTTVPQKGHGVILDISCGGALIASETRVPAGMPVIMNFRIESEITMQGTIVRTGLLKNNPSEIAQKFSSTTHGDAYIAVEFNDPLDDKILSRL